MANFEDLKPGTRVKLHGFTGAYVPSTPTGTIHGYDGEWFGVVFDPHVRFTAGNKRRKTKVPPRPYYGFGASTFEIIHDLPYQWASRDALRYWLTDVSASV